MRYLIPLLMLFGLLGLSVWLARTVGLTWACAVAGGVVVLQVAEGRRHFGRQRRAGR
jgi:hypothetical protein